MADTTAVTSTVRPPTIEDVDLELASTRRMLEALPDAQWDWKPHAKSRSLGGLANHVVDAVVMVASPLRSDALDVAAEGRVNSPNREQLLSRFDEHADAVRSGLGGREQQGWDGTWRLVRGDMALWTMPRPMAFRRLISHLVHHRAQLSTYLRLVDAPVPGMYGPSADE
jgi:uncharacterized damage-inducible protein DinB